MGGGTTIRFGYEHPDRVARLITMGASSGAPAVFGAAGLTEGLSILQKGYRETTSDTMRQLVEVMTFDSSFATDDLVAQRAETVASQPAHTRNFIDGIGNRAVVEVDQTKAPSITAPTLLLHAGTTRGGHFEHSLKLVSLIPDSRLVLLNQCGHWLQINHAAEFNRLVLDFMANT
jgi:2-hydroxy-6-oxonona-2,4-dienedioate hydrolase